MPTHAAMVFVGLSFFLGTVLTGHPCRSDEPPDYRKFVAALASTNPPPKIIDRRRVMLSPRFHWPEHERVVKVTKQIAEHPVDAWSAMIEHADDERYGLTLNIDDRYYNWSVGMICRTLLNESIQGAYREHSPAGKPANSRLHRPDYIPGDTAEFKAWCRTQEKEGRELYELQLDAAEWALAELPHLSGLVSANELDESIAGLRKQLKSLKQTEEPVLPNKRFFSDGRAPIQQRDH